LSSIYFGGFNYYPGQNKIYSFSTFYDTKKSLLDSSVYAILPMFSPVESGYYGLYEYPEWTYIIGARRRDFDFNSQIYSGIFGFDYTSINNVMKANLVSDLAPTGINTDSFIKVDGRFLKGIKVIPKVIIVPQINLGYSKGLPDKLRYEASQLRGYSKFQKGDRFGSVSLDLMFPLVYGLKTKLLNSIVFRGLAADIYYEVGDVWNGDLQNGFSDTKNNVGLELNFLFSFMADIKIPLTLGYGINLSDGGVKGDDNEYYFSINSPINLFALYYGH